MRLRVLGCGGGIGGREPETTCLLLDDDILFDAGTGIGRLALEQLLGIEHVFLSHAHLDHVAGLALLLDAVAGKNSQPLTVHGAPQTLELLRIHLFNWALWPDFTEIPSRARPTMRWQPLPDETPVVIGGRSIAAYAVNHAVEARAYWVHNGARGFLYTGDTTSVPHLWEAFRHEKKLDKVIVDCSFPNREHELACASGHFCPRSLIEDLRPMPAAVEFLVFHLKPGQEAQIMQELASGDPGRRYTALKSADTFTF